MFIVIEGIDYSGKSTIAKELQKLLRENGYSVEVTEEPTKGKIGRLIREILKEEHSFNEEYGKMMALLFTADRFQHLMEIRELLSQNDIVIGDRYYHSTLAYQSAYAGISMGWIWSIHEGVIRPDATFIMDITTDVLEERAKARGAKSFYDKRLDFLKNVRYNYLKLPHFLKDEKIYIIDNTKDISASLGKIIEILKKDFNLEINF